MPHLFLSLFLQLSMPGHGATIVLPEFVTLSCRRPVAVPAPKPPPKEEPTPGPTPPPIPPVMGPFPIPKPPEILEADGPEPESLGIALLDEALAGTAPKNLLPLWHSYPWQKLTSQKLWTVFTLESLKTDGADLLASKPKDIERFCPRYASLNEEQRLIFWARFVSILAEQESSFDPLEITPTPSVGPDVFSTGLLMISLSSSRSSFYGCKMVQTQDHLFFWRRNLGCAIKIMNRLMKQDQAISWDPTQNSWKGLARYWEPLRDSRLKSAKGRLCVDEMINLRREMWRTESLSSRHPSRLDSEYRKAGESRFEKFLRMINETAFCQPLVAAPAKL